MHGTSLLTKTAYDRYLRLGVTDIGSPTMLDLKQARTATHYIWRTRRDGRVRSSHAENDGKVFAWDNPPPTGHPGDAPGCRCTAEPYSPPINEHMRMLFYGVSGWWPGWHNIDFINHYYFGRGRAVRLRDTGHLERVVDEYWQGRGDALFGQIADEARKNPAGAFQREVYNDYPMQNIVFSLGRTTIGCDFQGTSEWQGADHLKISGQGNFYLRDEFNDPLDIGQNSPLSSVYRIVDDWMGLFNGTIYVERERSRYAWRERLCAS